MILTPPLFNVIFGMFFLLVLLGALLIYKKRELMLFILGGIFWAGLIENVYVLIGGYDYFTYPEVQWKIFFGVVPLTIIIGWIALTLALFTMVSYVLSSLSKDKKERPAWVIPLISALFFVNFALIMDPIFLRNNLWRWTHPSLYIWGVPFSNWLGGFFLMFFYLLAFYKVIIRKEDFIFSREIRKVFPNFYPGTAFKFFFTLLILYLIFFFIHAITSTFFVIFSPVESFNSYYPPIFW